MSLKNAIKANTITLMIPARMKVTPIVVIVLERGKHTGDNLHIILLLIHSIHELDFSHSCTVWISVGNDKTTIRRVTRMTIIA